MRICYLMHNLDSKNGGGRLGGEFIAQVRKEYPAAEVSLLTTVASGATNEAAILYPDKIRLLFSLPALRRRLKQYDIIHAFDGSPYGIIAALAHWRLKNKFIITAVGSGSLQPLHTWWLRPLMKWAYRQADAVTAISSYTAREVHAFIPETAVQAIPLGIRSEYFTDQGTTAAVRAAARTLRPYILSVGRVKPRKGYDISLRVFAALKQQLPQLQYVIVGNGRGSYYRELQALADRLDVSGSLIFKEGIDDEELACLYREAELFLLLPQNVGYDVEGFGLVFLEAAAFGLPVIGTRDSGAEDAVWDGHNGFLVPPQDVTAAVARAREILHTEELRSKLQANSLRFAKKMSWQRAVSPYLALYQNL